MSKSYDETIFKEHLAEAILNHVDLAHTYVLNGIGSLNDEYIKA